MTDRNEIDQLKAIISEQNQRIEKLEDRERRQAAHIKQPSKILAEELSNALTEYFGAAHKDIAYNRYQDFRMGFNAVVKQKYNVSRMDRLTIEQMEEAITLIPAYMGLVQRAIKREARPTAFPENMSHTHDLPNAITEGRA